MSQLSDDGLFARTSLLEFNQLDPDPAIQDDDKYADFYRGGQRR